MFLPRSMLAALVAGVLVLIAGCEGALPSRQQEAPPVEERTPPAAPGAEAQAQPGPGPGAEATVQPLPEARAFEGDPLDDPTSVLATRVVYFDFDSAEIKPEDRPVIEAHAQYLAEHPSAIVQLEGHADERGSREYNIALGERRALAVKRLATLLGASESQLRTISFGEERPAVEGHDETAWSQNRRVELNYIAR